MPHGRSPSRRAADLYGLAQPHFLDFPGSPVTPGCVYRRYFANRIAAEDMPRVAYAHIYQEPDTDELALQYWMFYYFNDWNNNHEGDWEMVMLFFDADTVEEALQQEPTRVMYAQHGGGEWADWDDDKLSKEDGRPVVYCRAGSARQLLRTARLPRSGRERHRLRLRDDARPAPPLRAGRPSSCRTSRPARTTHTPGWAITGRWGEFRRSEWNGPTGPNAKTSWTAPVSWAGRQRDTSLIVPTFEGFGQSPVDSLLRHRQRGIARPRRVLARSRAGDRDASALVVVAIGWVVSYASRTVRQAFGYYRRNLHTFGLIGATLIPTGYVVATLQTLLFRVPPIEPLVGMMQRFPGVRDSCSSWRSAACRRRWR